MQLSVRIEDEWTSLVDMSEPLFNFSSHLFTDAGRTGSNGPTLAQCSSAYASASFLGDLSLFDVVDGIQLWAVPKTQDYRITAKGASRGGRIASVGGPGAVRIVWGPGRSFPNNAL